MEDITEKYIGKRIMSLSLENDGLRLNFRGTSIRFSDSTGKRSFSSEYSVRDFRGTDFMGYDIQDTSPKKRLTIKTGSGNFTIKAVNRETMMYDDLDLEVTESM